MEFWKLLFFMSLCLWSPLAAQGEELHGMYTEYHEDGSKKAIANYEHGALHGRQATWNDQGLLVKETHYHHGKLNGRHYELKPHGQEVIYHYKDDVLHGLHELYHPPHKIFGRVKAFQANFNEGVIDGEVVEYNEAGTKTSSVFYHDGMKDGIASFYDPQGHILITAEFKNNKQNGMTYRYFPNGTVSQQVAFANDLKQGEEKTFHPNGQLGKLYVYKNDVLHGTCCEWTADGVLIFEAEYTDGKRNGKFNKYDEAGNPRVLQVYQDDVLIEKVKPGAPS